MLDLRTLVAELKAIECWDADYYRLEKKDKQAVIAFNLRQQRRREIIKLIFPKDKQSNFEPGAREQSAKVGPARILQKRFPA
jgi:bisphosphoglycerate-independent phosphoglycerate mutase (AlkP superfamily)